MDEKEIFNKMVEILRSYTKDPSLLDRATMDTHILNDLKVNSARLVDVTIMSKYSSPKARKRTDSGPSGTTQNRSSST
jgi:hypothetical protein